MGRIEIFRTNGESYRVPAAEAALASATLGLVATDAGAQRRLALVIRDSAFENPSDADLAGYGNAWFR